MENQEQKTDGSILSVGEQNNASGAGIPVSSLTILRAISQTRLEDLPPEDRREVLRILARGAVLCSALFIVLSYFYPDKTTMALSILVPIISLLAQHKDKFLNPPEKEKPTDDKPR